MNVYQNRNSRRVSTLLVPAGGKKQQKILGDYFQIYSVTAAGLTISVNGDDFAPFTTGLIHGGVVGRDDIDEVEFYNATGGDITVVMVFGKGTQSITGQVNLSAADLLVVTPAAVTVDCDLATITTAVAYASKTSIKVANVGGANITVTPAGGSARTLAPTEEVYWVTLRQQDVLKTITVDATGSTAKVVWTA